MYSPLWNINPDTGSIEQEYIVALTQGGVRDGMIPKMIMAASTEEFENVWSSYEEAIKTLPGREETLLYFQAEINKRAGQ